MSTTEFEQMVLQIRPQMMGVALAFFQNKEDAEDAVQEVMLKMWRRKWHPNDDMKAVAMLATKNQCISMTRKQRLRLNLPLEDAAKAHAENSDADQSILTREHHMLIELAISTLSRSEQRIIRLKQENGLDAEEISIITGIQVSSVRSMLSMARKKLIKKLKI